MVKESLWKKVRLPEIVITKAYLHSQELFRGILEDYFTKEATLLITFEDYSVKNATLCNIICTTKASQLSFKCATLKDGRLFFLAQYIF